MTTVSDTTINEIVKPMDRGQITIPIKIRKKLNITSKSWLWIRLIKNKILVEPIKAEETIGSLTEFLKKNVNDKNIYWQIEDVKALRKVEKKSRSRLKRYI